MFSYSVYYSIVNASPWILITRNKLFFRRVSFYTFFFFFFPNEWKTKKNHSRGRSPYLQCKVRRCVDCSSKNEKLRKEWEENICYEKHDDFS